MPDERIVEKLLRINDLATDVYRRKQRISSLLAENAFSETEIAFLREEGLPDFLDHLDFALQCTLTGFSYDERCADILYGRYGLFGHKQETLEEIGKRRGLSRERVRQLQESLLSKLRRWYFEHAVVSAAARVLHKELSSVFPMAHIWAEAKKETAGKTATQRGKRKIPFVFTEEMKGRWSPTPYSTTLSIVIKSINAVRPSDMKSLCRRPITEFLLAEGILEHRRDPGYGSCKVPTQKGLDMGISLHIGEKRLYALYDTEAQRYIADHINDLTESPIAYNGDGAEETVDFDWMTYAATVQNDEEEDEDDFAWKGENENSK